MWSNDCAGGQTSIQRSRRMAGLSPLRIRVKQNPQRAHAPPLAENGKSTRKSLSFAAAGRKYNRAAGGAQKNGGVGEHLRLADAAVCNGLGSVGGEGGRRQGVGAGAAITLGSGR